MFAELFTSLMPLVALFATVTMLVLRAGASRIFFDVVGSFQATRLIGDAQAKITVLQGLVLDGLSGITEGVGLIAEQFNQLVDSTVPLSQEIGYARIEFEKFVQTGDDADAMAAQIEEIGMRFGFAGDQALAAGSKMAQLSSLVGGGQAVPAATEIGIAFGMVGGMETEEAMKRLINLQQQTTFMFGGLTQAQYNNLSAQKQVNLIRQESIKILNQLNTIENRSSATMAQVTHVMNQFASSAKLAGDDITYMAAASATLIEAGEEQGKAGRALKMIYARLGADTGNNSEILAQFGIQTKTATGELRSLEAILTDVSSIYPQLSNAQRLQIAQAMAGNDHYVRAIKLMDNYNRTMQLESMATQELDTAQAELNKRFEDNAFLLTQAEANLKNAKAELGDQFTPAVIQATNAQAELTRAFAQTAQDARDMHPALGGLMDGLLQVTQVGRTFAPFVEANLNIMSLNVSLQTQLQIQRALAGQDIVRASAYGQQGSLLRANLGTISQTAAMDDRRALTAASMLSVDRSRIQAQQNLMTLQGYEVTNNRAAIQDEIKALQLEHATIKAKETELRLEQLLTPHITQQREARLAQIELERQDAQIKKNKLNYYSLEQAYLDENIGYKRLQGKSAEYLMQADKRLLLHKHAMKRFEEENLDIARQRMQLQHTINDLTQEESQLTMGVTNTDKIRLKQIQKELQMANELLQQEGKRQIMSFLNQDIIMGEARAAQILRDAHAGVIAATMQKSNVEQQNNAIMQAVEQAAQELAVAYNLDEAALRRLLPTLRIFEEGLERVRLQSEVTVTTQMNLNNVMMKFTGILGAGSMVFGMFGDDAKAARISMFLLNLSMIPMTVQMIASTKASYGLMTGFNASGVAAQQAAVKVSGLKKALMLTGVGVGLAALGYIAYKLMPDLKDETDDLSASLENMSAVAVFNSDTYKRMSQDMANMDLNDILFLREHKEKQIADLKNDMLQITEPALLRIRQDQVAAAQDELDALQQIQAIRQAERLIGDQDEMSALFGLVKRAQEMEPEEQGYMDAAKHFLTNPLDAAGVAFRQMVGVKGSANMANTEFIKQQEAANAAYKDALAAIPEEFHGAILETARIAKDETEFLEMLKRDFQDFGDDLGDPGGVADALKDNFIGPLEAAKEAAFEFSNAREEMFFGMSKGNITGDMVKQVVNKGVETLINTTEVIMTNNFTGMTTTQAANEITKQVVEQLNARGLNLSL